MDTAAQAVAVVGGTLTHRLAVIDAVGAEMTGEQIAVARRIEGIRVLEDEWARGARRERPALRHR